MLIVDILDHAALFQVGGPQTPGQSAILFPQPLLIDEHGKAFFKAELTGFGGFQLRAEGVGDSVQFHGVKFLDGLLIQHRDSFLPALLHQLGGRIVVQRSAQVFMARARPRGAPTASESSTSWRSSERFRIDFRL